VNLFAGFYALPPATRYCGAGIVAAIVLMVVAAANSEADSWDRSLAITHAASICAMIALAVISRYSTRVAPHIGWIATFAASVLLGHLSLAIYLHGLLGELAIATLFANALISVTMHTHRLLATHLVVWCLVPLAVGFMTASSEAYPLLYAIGAGAQSAFLYFMNGAAIETSERMRHSDSVMDAMFDHSADALMYVDTNCADVIQVNARAAAFRNRYARRHRRVDQVGI
jgi:hypothetical protein